MQIGTETHLIRKRKDPVDHDEMKYLVPDGSIYEALVRIHKETGHKGINVMVKKCAQKYGNVTRDMIEVQFLTY